MLKLCQKSHFLKQTWKIKLFIELQEQGDNRQERKGEKHVKIYEFKFIGKIFQLFVKI